MKDGGVVGGIARMEIGAWGGEGEGKKSKNGGVVGGMARMEIGAWFQYWLLEGR
jgi:hypothetical protein